MREVQAWISKAAWLPSQQSVATSVGDQVIVRRRARRRRSRARSGATAAALVRDVLLPEAGFRGAVREPVQVERAVGEMRQHRRGDECEVADEVALRDRFRVVVTGVEQDLVEVRELELVATDLPRALRSPSASSAAISSAAVAALRWRQSASSRRRSADFAGRFRISRVGWAAFAAVGPISSAGGCRLRRGRASARSSAAASRCRGAKRTPRRGPRHSPMRIGCRLGRLEPALGVADTGRSRMTFRGSFSGSRPLYAAWRTRSSRVQFENSARMTMLRLHPAPRAGHRLRRAPARTGRRRAAAHRAAGAVRPAFGCRCRCQPARRTSACRPRTRRRSGSAPSSWCVPSPGR